MMLHVIGVNAQLYRTTMIQVIYTGLGVLSMIQVIYTGLGVLSMIQVIYTGLGVLSMIQVIYTGLGVLSMIQVIYTVLGVLSTGFAQALKTLELGKYFSRPSKALNLKKISCKAFKVIFGFELFFVKIYCDSFSPSP